MLHRPDPRVGLAEILAVALPLLDSLSQVERDPVCYQLGRHALHLVQDALRKLRVCLILFHAPSLTQSYVL